MSAERIAIVGAGLTGPVLALMLRERGFHVQLYERRADPRLTRATKGRSINLALSVRGIHTLRESGVWTQIEPLLIPMRGRMIHALSSQPVLQPYSQREEQVINSVSRSELNMLLLDAVEARGIPIAFENRFGDAAIPRGVILAADGANSGVRHEMSRLPRFNLSQRYLDYGYKELIVPAASNGSFAMEPHALHIWPRGTFMLIALPNIDRSFAATLFLPFEGKDSFDSLRDAARIQEFFDREFPDAAPLLPDIANHFLSSPIGTMVTVECDPWSHDLTLLIGDAAHAIVPFFGQGLNCALEDVTVLMELLDRVGADWPVVFKDFFRARKENTDSIAALALENFIEMRDRVADPAFAFRKQVDFALENRFPGVYIPKYSMVTFHRIPYSVARLRGQIQDGILDDICCNIQELDAVDWSRAEQLVRQRLSPVNV